MLSLTANHSFQEMGGHLAYDSPAHSRSHQIKTMMTTHYHYYSPLGPFKGLRTICLELKKCKINTSFFAQAENNPLCHSKFSKYLPLKNI